MMLKEKLEAVDPAKLEAGAETDRLVAECLGCRVREWKHWKTGEPRSSCGCPPTNSMEHGGTHGIPDSKPRFLPYSTSPGLAFEVPWQWLLDTLQDTAISIYQNPGQGPRLRMSGRLFPDGWIISAQDSAMALCGAVVAVAKARSR